VQQYYIAVKLVELLHVEYGQTARAEPIFQIFNRVQKGYLPTDSNDSRSIR